MAWLPIKILERKYCKKLGDAVANEHLGKCARTCLTNIWVAGSQNGMKKPEGKTCFITSCQKFMQVASQKQMEAV